MPVLPFLLATAVTGVAKSVLAPDQPPAQGGPLPRLPQSQRRPLRPGPGTFAPQIQEALGRSIVPTLTPEAPLPDPLGTEEAPIG